MIFNWRHILLDEVCVLDFFGASASSGLLVRVAVVEFVPRAACAGEEDTKHGDGEMKNG